MTLPNALTQTQNDVEFPRCHKCEDWNRLGLSSRCPYHETPVQLVPITETVNEGDGR